jgi:hypothetical protein
MISRINSRKRTKDHGSSTRPSNLWVECAIKVGAKIYNSGKTEYVTNNKHLLKYL